MHTPGRKYPIDVDALYFDDIPSPEEEHDTERLYAAAYSSYDRHCGVKAVELAEGDLLGQALAALRGFCHAAEQVIEMNGPIAEACPLKHRIEQARALLAKLPKGE